jgi:HK97 family phage prohead protease
MNRLAIAFEIKASTDGDVGTFEGYGSVFGTVDSYRDTVTKGAFRASLESWGQRKRLPKMLLQHGGGFFGGGADDMVPIGKWSEMREDDHGLFARGRLFNVDTDRAKATYAALKEGELDGLSIGFSVPDGGAVVKDGRRTLNAIDLWEVSLVTFPANDPARVTGVKADGDLPSERDFEQWLQREAGLTRAQARGVIAKGYRQMRREAMSSDESVAELLAAMRAGAAILAGR